MWEKLKYQLRHGNIITKLLIVNIGVFVVQSIIYLFFSLSGNASVFENFLSWLYFPKKLLDPLSTNDLVTKPWSIITYQFLHDPLRIFHILFNMLYLYFFGRILVDFLNPRNVLPLYITGGIVGAFIFMLTYNLSPVFSGQDAVLVGASASILALVVAAATLVPDYTVFLILIGPLKLKYIVFFALLIDIISINGLSNAGGHLAHLGGALTGFLFVKSYRRGVQWFSFWFTLEDRIKNRFSRKPRIVFVNRTRDPQIRYQEIKNSPKETMYVNTDKRDKDDKQKRTDEILDKIAKSGYESLSAKEKEFLFKISNEK
ncbi:MAG: rhomboid family intramembrane serine protease [Chitinophagales bacterium]|nr:rhomboid family intramembrane serine protease [Chitinophagales bacterium]